MEGGGVNATIILSDIAATNGYLHIIDRVLGIPYMTVQEKIETDPMLKWVFFMVFWYFEGNSSPMWNRLIPPFRGDVLLAGYSYGILNLRAVKKKKERANDALWHFLGELFLSCDLTIVGGILGSTLRCFFVCEKAYFDIKKQSDAISSR